MSTSDEDWIAAARARAASGAWERPADAIFAGLKRESAARAASAPQLPACPYCADHPALLRFRRFELQTIEPLLFCGQCFGFWAKGDALARGVADPGTGHPALEVGLAPRRCRACFGHLKPDDSCAKCGQALPRLNCPGCGEAMERFEKEGVTLDQCTTCRGTWFDMGEIVRVYGLAPAQGLAASTVDEHATDGEPPGWLLALQVASRIAFPFLPF